MKDQIIADERDLEDKLTEAWQNLNGDLLQSVFYEWTGRLEWFMEYDGEYYINIHKLNRSRISGSREKQGGHNFRYRLYSISEMIVLQFMTISSRRSNSLVTADKRNLPADESSQIN
jgi:hypothetical protein